MATTPYDEQEKGYLNLIANAKTVEEVSAAQSQLNNLSAIKWDTVSIDDMKSEIDYRFAVQDKGIYTSSYKTWKATLETGNQDEIREAAKKLLKTSDKIIYATTAKAKRTKIQEEQERLAGNNKVDTGGTGTATLSGGSAYTVTQDENGVFTLTPNNTSIVVKEGTVIGGRVDANSLEQDVNLLDRRPAWTDTNIEYHRKKTADGFAIDSAIIKRYYSVIDAEVYFGNEYVEDVHDINWAVRQNVQPLFGYNSYTYDEIARGNRLIIGNFTIAFTSPNYLFTILAEAAKANSALVENMASYSVPKLSDMIEPSARSGNYGARESGHHAPMWPQTFDIDIIFGEKSGAGDPVHVIILGVAIQDCQTVLSASAAGTPPAVMEQYSFIAQDVRTSVLSATGKNVEAPVQTNQETKKEDNSNMSQAEKTALGIPSDQTTVDAEIKKAREQREAEKEKKQQKKEAKEQAEKMKNNKKDENNTEEENKNDTPTTPVDNGQNTPSDNTKSMDPTISAIQKGITSATQIVKVDEKTTQIIWTYSATKGELTEDEIRATAEGALRGLKTRTVDADKYNFDIKINGNVATVTIAPKT